MNEGFGILLMIVIFFVVMGIIGKITNYFAKKYHWHIDKGGHNDPPSIPKPNIRVPAQSPLFKIKHGNLSRQVFESTGSPRPDPPKRESK